MKLRFSNSLLCENCQQYRLGKTEQLLYFVHFVVVRA
jgi:hypothetical protein